VKRLSSEFGVSACSRALDVSRSTACYKRKARLPADLSSLKHTIATLRMTFRAYGVRRMHLTLRGLGLGVTRRTVRQAYLEMGLLKKTRRQRVRTTNSCHNEQVYPNLVKGVVATAPDEIWAADVTYLRVQSRFAYLALLMDVYTREILGWHVAYVNDTALTLEALRMALGAGRTPKVHHSDQGSNYAAKRYVLELAGTSISMTQMGRPQDNGFAERLNRTVKEEEILHSEYQDLHEARQGIGAYVQVYNEQRIHSSLGYRKPSEVFRAWVLQQEGGTPLNSS
jgi:putative transposase